VYSVKHRDDLDGPLIAEPGDNQFPTLDEAKDRLEELWAKPQVVMVQIINKAGTIVYHRE
jgi:hypothetical protein